MKAYHLYSWLILHISSHDVTHQKLLETTIEAIRLISTIAWPHSRFDVIAEILVLASSILIIARSSVLEPVALLGDEPSYRHNEVMVGGGLRADSAVITGLAVSVPVAGADITLIVLHQLIYGNVHSAHSISSSR